MENFTHLDEIFMFNHVYVCIHFLSHTSAHCTSVHFILYVQWPGHSLKMLTINDLNLQKFCMTMFFYIGFEYYNDENEIDAPNECVTMLKVITEQRKYRIEWQTKTYSHTHTHSLWLCGIVALLAYVRWWPLHSWKEEKKKITILLYCISLICYRKKRRKTII